MVITDVRIRKLHSEGRMKAIVSITFDDAFAVHDIKVVEGDKGLFVAMPSKRMPDGEYKDIAHPINSETRAELERSSGVSSSTIQKLENGSYDVNMVKLGTLIALAQALHCKVVDLLDKDLQKVIG